MKYSGNSKVYGIRYFNVWFYLLMKMKDIHWWCIRHNIKYKVIFKYRKEYPVQANIWNLYTYCRFRLETIR